MGILSGLQNIKQNDYSFILCFRKPNDPRLSDMAEASLTGFIFKILNTSIERNNKYKTKRINQWIREHSLQKYVVISAVLHTPRTFEISPPFLRQYRVFVFGAYIRFDIEVAFMSQFECNRSAEVANGLL